MNGYNKGDLVRVAAAFTNAAGTAIDPTAVFAEYRSPTGALTTLEYVADVELVRDSTGNYHVDISASVAGYYSYRFYAVGTGQSASDKEQFQVEDNRL
jgi:hypothetical protein